MSASAVTWAYEQADRLRLEASECAVLVFLADAANGSGVAWPGQERIARYTRLGLRTVGRALGQLAALGLIVAVPRGKSRLYTLKQKGNGADHSDTPEHRPPWPMKRSRTPAMVADVATPDIGHGRQDIGHGGRSTSAMVADKPSIEPRKTQGGQEGEAEKIKIDEGETGRGPPASSAGPEPAGATTRGGELGEEAGSPVPPGKVAGALARAARSLRPPPEAYAGRPPKLSRNEQIDEMERAAAPPPPKRGPQPPQRSVAEQMAAMLAAVAAQQALAQAAAP